LRAVEWKPLKWWGEREVCWLSLKGQDLRLARERVDARVVMGLGSWWRDSTETG
jgi:hypothetical protein